MSNSGDFGPKFASYRSFGPSDKSTTPGCFFGSTYSANLRFDFIIEAGGFAVQANTQNVKTDKDKMRQQSFRIPIL